MPRKGPITPKKTQGDLIYNDPILTKFINSVMKDGKKSVAQGQVYGALGLIKDSLKKDALEVFLTAIENVKPEMEVRSRRVGGAAYQVPMPVRGPRRQSLAIRWIINAARARANSQYHTFSEKLAAELTDAYNGEGGAIKKRTEMERIAEANRAFAHFRW